MPSHPHVVQMFARASRRFEDVDVLRVAALPGFFVKQLANIAQLIGACRTLARVDIVEITAEDFDDE